MHPFIFMMNLIHIGKIINTHGLKGEVKIESYSDFDEIRYQKGNTVYLETGEEVIPLQVKTFRIHKGNPLVTFAGYEDINRIEPYKGCFLSVQKENRPPLKKNEYYQTDLIGLSAYDEKKNYLGVIQSVEPTNGAQNNLRIQKEDKKTFLVPCIPEFVKKVNLERKEIIIHMERGLE